MLSREEWTILVLWAIAILATAALAGQDGTFLLGTVFFGCSVGSLIAIRKAQFAHVEGILVLLWLISMGAMFATIPQTIGEMLSPVYFVCLVGSLITARRAYRTQ